MRSIVRRWLHGLLLLPGVAAACGEPFSAGPTDPTGGGGAGASTSSPAGGNATGGDGLGANASGGEATGASTPSGPCDPAKWSVPDEIVVNEPFAVSYTDTEHYPDARLMAASEGTYAVDGALIDESQGESSYTWQYQLNLGTAAEWSLQFIGCLPEATDGRYPTDGGYIDAPVEVDAADGSVEPECENVVSSCLIDVAPR